MRKLILAICFISAFIFGAPEVNAQCDCIGSNRKSLAGNRENDHRGSIYATAYEEFEKSEVIFIGEFVEITKIERLPAFKSGVPYEYEIKFKVKKVWKTNLEEIVSLRFTAGCLISFEKRKEYLVYAFVHEGILRTNYCSRTRLLSKAADDLKEFEEKGEKPRDIIKGFSLKP